MRKIKCNPNANIRFEFKLSDKKQINFREYENWKMVLGKKSEMKKHLKRIEE